jgi:uncharacterized protein (AIM24 family)
LPIYLALGVQTIPTIAANKSVTLPTKTNFGQKVKYKATGECLVKKNKLTAMKGKCTISARAKSQDELFGALKTKVVLKIK